MSEPIRVLFLGTPAISVPTLQALLEDSVFKVLGVITQPDKPAGRGKKLTPPPVKVLAEESGLPVFQPKSLRKDTDLIQWIREQSPDYLVTIAFGQILSQEVLDIPKLGTVNVHASLLPELRGANPIQFAIIQGKTESGLTTMLTDIGVDTGAILLKEVVSIAPNETAGELAERYTHLAGPLLVKTLKEYAAGVIQAIPQSHELATHAPKLSKEDAVLDWNQPAQQLHNKIRGQHPWPGTVTYFNGEPLKICQSRLPANPENFMKNQAPGTILGIIKEGIQVQTGDGSLNITMVQPAGKKEMSARDWANGSLQDKTATYYFTAPKTIPV